MREFRVPSFVAHLPVDPRRGIPIPWFVAWTVDGRGPEFRAAQGRDATRAEVVDAIDSGMPALRELAEPEGPDAVLELAARRRDVARLLPAGAGGR